MHLTSRPTAFVARLARTAAVVLLAGAGLSAAAVVASADDVSWTVRTASNSYGTERSRFAYTLDPGGAADDALVVANRGTAALDLQVYAADGYTTDAGQFDVLTQDTASKAIGTWVQVDTTTVTVQPGASVELPFTVSVPTAATPGDYSGAVVTSIVRPGETQGVNVDQRLGIRLDVHVSGAISPALAVEDVGVHYDGTLNPFASGDATVTYAIHNTGNVVISARQAASVVGPFGWASADAGDVAAPPELLPGESWHVEVPVHGVLPLFRLTATVTLTPLFTDASGSTTSLDAVTATAAAWAVPWTALVVLVLLVALVVWLLLRRRRARARRGAVEAERIQQAVDAALRERDAAGTVESPL